MACAAASDNAAVAMPTPTIKIDNTSDPFATIVKVDFGDRLGELLDTVCLWHRKRTTCTLAVRNDNSQFMSVDGLCPNILHAPIL